MTTQLSTHAATEALPVRVQLAFAPLHKRAFGMAAGITFGLLVALLTVLHVVRSPGQAYPLTLLSEYFYGYTVSLSGALVGFFWGGLAAFVFGWFLAFCRNLAVAAMLFVGRTKAELAATRDFLDHI